MKLFNCKRSSRKITEAMLLSAIIAGSAAMMSSAAFAGNGWFGGHGGDHHERMDHRGLKRFEKMADHLDFTDEQEAQLKTILEAAKAELGEGGRREMMMQMMSLDPESGDYDAQVEEAAADIADKVKSKIVVMANVRKQIHALLTEEQKEELKEKMEKRMKRIKN